MFDVEQKIVLETDASDYAIGACLSQRHIDGKLHHVAYYSQKLSAAELSYDVYNKEMFAIVVALSSGEYISKA